MNRRITTLRSLAAPAGTTHGHGHAPPLDPPENLAATLHQLARIIQQTSDAPLPSGTSVDWPLPEALSAAARLDGDESGAFRGHGRVLGPMYAHNANGQQDATSADERVPRRRYNLRSHRGTGTPGKTSRFSSGSSMSVRRGSIAETEAGVEVEADAEADAEAEKEIETNIEADGTARKTGTVMRDETQSGRSRSLRADGAFQLLTNTYQDGTRKIQVHLRRSRGSVTLVIPKSPETDRPPPTATEARDTAHLPEISFQLSPGFHLPTEEMQRHQPAMAPESHEGDYALDFLDSGFYEDEAEDQGHDDQNDQNDRNSFYDSLHLWSDMSDDDDDDDDDEPRHYFEAADAVDSHAAHTYNGHPQPPVGTRLEQVLVYLRSQDPSTDRHWHVRAAAIEAYLDFLQQGIPEPGPSSTAPASAKCPEAALVADQQARLDAALARIETDEQFACAAMDGRPADVDADANANTDANTIACENAVYATQPLPILGARTLAILDEARRQLAVHRAFFGLPQGQARARIVDSVSDVSLSLSQPDGNAFLQTLLATTGRSFAARMAMNARAEASVQFDENFFHSFPGQAARHKRNKHHKHHSKDEDNTKYLFDSEHALLEGTPLARLETHPFTVQMARYRRFRQHYMEEARILAEQTHGGDDGWATLPPTDGVYSLGYSKVSDASPATATASSPRLVPRQPLPPHMERDRQLLQLLRGLSRLLVRRLDTAPRPLLADVAKYAEQGLSGLPAPELLAPESAGRPLSETEARWLQFLLSDSTNEQLAGPLPRADEDEDEGGSRALYYAFAHRFQALLDADAMHPDGLFSTADRLVPVADVVNAINGQPGTAFSVYDGMHFLSRLSRAGRCRFRHFPGSRDHGVVQRPLLTIHPEHRIRASSSAPCRATDVAATWDDDTIARARQTGQTVPASVHNFFCSLGFRLGHTLHALETSGRAQWRAYLDEQEQEQEQEQDTQAAGGEAMRRSLCVWNQTYEQLVNDSGALDEAAAGGIPTSFKDVIRLADEKVFSALINTDAVHAGTRKRKKRRRRDTFTEEAARAYVYRQLIAEAARGHDVPINSVTHPVSRGVWDWAQPAIVGEAPRHFFHMDRWPLQLQTKATASHVKEGARIAMDPEMLWDPASEDLTPAEYLWSVSTADRRYGFRRIETAETQYRRGDTALQRQVVVHDITRRVAAAIGVDVDELGEPDEPDEPSKTKQGIAGWLWSKLGKRKRERDDGNDDDDDGNDDDDDGINVFDFAVTELPKVKDVPKSVDWTEMDPEADFEVDEAEAGGDGDEFGLKAAEEWTDEDDRTLIREIYATQGV